MNSRCQHCIVQSKRDCIRITHTRILKTVRYTTATYKHRPTTSLTECDSGTIQKSHLGTFTVETFCDTIVCLSTTKLTKSNHRQPFHCQTSTSKLSSRKDERALPGHLRGRKALRHSCVSPSNHPPSQSSIPYFLGLLPNINPTRRVSLVHGGPGFIRVISRRSHPHHPAPKTKTLEVADTDVSPTPLPNIPQTYQILFFFLLLNVSDTKSKAAT